MSSPGNQLKQIDCDQVTSEVDPSGKYRRRSFVWTLIAAICCCVPISDYVFVTRSVPYRCKVPACENEDGFRASWLNYSMPHKSECVMYEARSNFSIRMNNSMSSCTEQDFDNETEVQCQQVVFESPDSFTEEMGIACENWKRTFVGTIHQFGMLAALPVVGFISDKYGRKVAFLLSAISYVTFGVIKSFTANYWLYLTFDFLAATMGSGAFTCCYILVLESMRPERRVIGGAIVPVMFSFGQMIKGGLARFLPYWRTYVRFTFCVTSLSLASFWLMDESCRWMLSQKKYQRFKEAVKKMAEKNGTKLSAATEDALNFNVEACIRASDSDQENKSKKESPYLSVIKSKILVVRTLSVCFLWMTCNFCAYGFAVYAVEMAGNVYMNFILLQMVTAFAFGLGVPAMHFFKRKPVLCSSFFISFALSIAYTYLPRGHWSSLLTYLGADMFLMLAFDVLYMFTSEVFPTTLRHSILGFCSMFGKTGSLVSPQVPLLATYMPQLPMMMFAGTCLLSSLLTLTFPETFNRKLPETIEDSKGISKSKSKLERL